MYIDKNIRSGLDTLPMHAEAQQDAIFILQKSLSTPSHISSLAFGHAGHLFAGSGMFIQVGGQSPNLTFS